MSETSTVKILFLGDSAQAVRSVRTLESAFGSAGKAGKTLQSAVGVGLVAALAGATKQAVDFDKSMRNVNSIARLSEKQFKTLEDQIRSLSGPTTRKGPTDLANGLYDIVSSGFKAKDAMVVLKQSAVDASAGLTDTATASKAVVAVLNAYGLEAGKAKNVSSLLFKEVQLGVNTFEELAQNIGDTAPQAAALKIPFTEVAAALALITKHGTSMAEASTQVSRILTALIKPTNDLKAEFQHLGFENGQAAVAALGFTGVLQTLSKEAGGSQEKLAAWLGDVRGIRGVLNLTGSNLKEFGGFVDEMGAAFDRGNEHVKAFNEQGKSISAQWDAARSSLEAAAIPIGEVLFPALEKAAGAAEDLAGWLTDNEKGIERGFRDAGDAAKDLYEVVGPLAQALAHVSEIKLGNDSLLKLLIEATVLTKIARLAGSLGGKAGVAGEAEKAATKIGLIGGALSKLPASKVIAITIATKFAYDWEKKLFEKYLGADFGGIKTPTVPITPATPLGIDPRSGNTVPLSTLPKGQRAKAAQAYGRGVEKSETGAGGGKWAEQLLGMIGAPVNKNTLSLIRAWAAAENTKAAFNPLATTLPMQGASNFNSVGVKNYTTWQQGLSATAKTLLNTPSEGPILQALRGNLPAEDIARIIGLSPWGTSGSNIASLLGKAPGVRPYNAAGVKASSGGTGALGGLFAPLDFPLAGGMVGRADQGFDIESGSGNVGGAIRALGPGKVVSISSDPGGFGPTYLVYQITGGPLKGRYIFIGHSRATAKVGQTFAGGAQLATIQGGPGYGGEPGHIEMGFASASGAPLGASHKRAGDHFTPEGQAFKDMILGLYGGAGPVAKVKIPGKPGGGVTAGSGGAAFSWPSQFLPHDLQVALADAQASGATGTERGLLGQAQTKLAALAKGATGARKIAIDSELESVRGQIKSIDDGNKQAEAERKKKAQELLKAIADRQKALRAIDDAEAKNLRPIINAAGMTAGYRLTSGLFPAGGVTGSGDAAVAALHAREAAARARAAARLTSIDAATANRAGVGPDATDLAIAAGGTVGLRNARARAAINASTANRMGVGPSPTDLRIAIIDAISDRGVNNAALRTSRAPGISTANQILSVIGSLPAGATSAVSDIFGRVIGQNTEQTVRAKAQKLLAILKTETDPAKIEKATEGLKSLASVVTDMFTSAQQVAKQKADELVSNLKSDFSDALQRELQDALSVFDADTQRLLENSPTVKKLREEQDAHDAQARQDRVDAARKKLAQAQTGSTTNVDATVLAALGKLSRALGIQNAQAPLLGLPVEALTGGPLPTSVNTDDVVAAQKDLDDALYEQQVAADRKKADEETKSIQQSRQAERDALQDAYQAIVRDFERGNITAVQAQEKLVALLHDKVPAMANAGDLLGKAFADAMSAHFKAAGDYAAQVVTAISNQQSPPSYSGPSAPTFNNVPIPAGANVPIQVNVNPSSSYIPEAVFHGAGLGGPQGFAKGTIHVPYTGMALVHAGERIIPANRARAAGGDGGSVEQVLVHLSMDDNLNDLVTAQVAKSSDRIMLSIGTSSDVRRRGRRT